MGRGISGERSRGEGRINIASVQLDLCRYCCIYELVCDFYAIRGGVATKAVQSVNLCFYVAFERSYRRRSGLRKQMFLHITVSPTGLTQLVCFSLQLVSEYQWETTIWNVVRINFNISHLRRKSAAATYQMSTKSLILLVVVIAYSDTYIYGNAHKSERNCTIVE